MTLTYKISQSLIDRYSAGPSRSRITTVKALHENVRAALELWGDKQFDTFLQGSYRNDTAIADINDVDIVALYDPLSSPASRSEWEELFQHVANILRRSGRVTGTVTIRDKCIELAGTPKADIVPAVSRVSYSTNDPILIYSQRLNQERENYPRTHYEGGVAKQAETKGAYKATVRMFKRWARQYNDLNAPSFYIECAVHSVNSSEFSSYLPLSFASVGVALLGYSPHTVIMSVAGDKDILVPSEWRPSDFTSFQNYLRRDMDFVLQALRADTSSEADASWRLAFGER